MLLYGQWKRGRRGSFEVENPDYEIIAEDDDPPEPIHTGRRVPIYRRLGEIRTKELRSIVHHVIERVDLSEMEEVLGMSDRVVVMRERRIAGILPRPGLTAERIAALMTGGTEAPGAA